MKSDTIPEHDKTDIFPTDLWFFSLWNPMSQISAHICFGTWFSQPLPRMAHYTLLIAFYVLFGLQYLPCNHFQSPKNYKVRVIPSVLVAMLSCFKEDFILADVWVYRNTRLLVTACLPSGSRERNTCVFVFFFSSEPQFHKMLTPTFRVCLSSSVENFWNNPHLYIQRHVSI